MNALKHTATYGLWIVEGFVIGLSQSLVDVSLLAICLQVQPFLEQPIGMALYEWKDGKIGAVCMQGGEHQAATKHLECMCHSCHVHNVLAPA